MGRTAKASILNGFAEIVREFGHDPKTVMQQCNLSAECLAGPENLLPVTQVLQVLRVCAVTTKCPHFGVELAKRKNLQQHMGLIGEIAQSAFSLGSALQELCSFIHLHSEASLWQLQSNGEVSHISFALNQGEPDGYHQAEQLALTLLWRFIRLLVGSSWHPCMVYFTFDKPTDLVPYKKTFDVPVMFNADFCGVTFHSADLKIKLHQHNAERHQYLYQQAETLRLHKVVSLKETVRDLIRKNLEFQLTGEEHVIRFFPFERRTLQRRLSAEQTSYRELLNEVRISMAKELLLNSQNSITRIADRLCFADIANFSKTFRAQTGLSPTAWCKRHKI